MKDGRISGALASIHRGIDFAVKENDDSSRSEMRRLRLAVEEIRNGLAIIEDYLGELEHTARSGDLADSNGEPDRE